MSPRISRLSVGLFVLSVLSTTATGSSDGWDWDEELADSEWNDDNVDWTHVVHPEHPSESTIVRRLLPPPREPWCALNMTPSNQDCDEHRVILEEWLQDEIGKSPTQAAAIAPTYPSACWSPCYP